MVLISIVAVLAHDELHHEWDKFAALLAQQASYSFIVIIFLLFHQLVDSVKVVPDLLF